MPAWILTGPIFVDTPQQNSNGVNMGFNNLANYDANMKFNTAQGGNFGFMSINITAGSLMIDNMELLDGNINEQDVKNAPSVQV